MATSTKHESAFGRCVHADAILGPMTHAGVQFLDTTKLHAEAIVAGLLS